ncbi:DEAD/DEAH box helicase [Methanosphaerula subterraneus]|uniref:DEAD/DEAH box helicase n=1 Tax=Methanosphaerula subterraneus TaxID=3350244 RepID=UPI003F86FAC9
MNDQTPSRVLVCRLPVPGGPVPSYWEAGTFAAELYAGFEEYRAVQDLTGMRQTFYVLARYYGRTCAILRQSLLTGAQPLITSALNNLVTLHRFLHRMYEVAPSQVPVVITLDRESRRRLLPDLVMEVLEEAVVPLDPATVARRVNDLHVIAPAGGAVVSGVLDDLVVKGYALHEAGGLFVHARRVYRPLNLDREGLRALLGERLYAEFVQGGFPGLSDLVARKKSFLQFFERFAGCGADMADRFVAVSTELLEVPGSVQDLSPWRPVDLIGSTLPRPYQREAFAIFRGFGYQGQVIEAPTGSGKTLIGMLCIQDWLRTLSPGETILVLVPTVNYQRQWVGELCYAHAGLHLPPDAVFAGTPAELKAELTRSGFAPAVLVVTYNSLAQIGSPVGKGGFDAGSIEVFLQGNGVQYVVLDEVHKLVEGMHLVSTAIAGLLVEWLRDTSLRGLIGFSGTVVAFRVRLARIGLDLVHVVPPAGLIAAGFVAPFAEYGVPFAYSDRERRIVGLVNAYTAALVRYAALLTAPWLTAAFGRVPMDLRVRIGKNLLDLYPGRPDRDEALEARFRRWEESARVGVAEAPMITILQIALDLSDEELVAAAVADRSDPEPEIAMTEFLRLLDEISGIRSELTLLVRGDGVAEKLRAEGFGSRPAGEALLVPPDLGAARRVAWAKEILASTIAGLTPVVRSAFYRMGEGRVDSIRAVIRAERSVRPVPGVIVFDTAKRIRWQGGIANPGYAGVGGLFAQMIGTEFTPMAATSTEIYLPWSETDPLPARIAGIVRGSIMAGELEEALFGLVLAGVKVSEEGRLLLRRSLAELVREYTEGHPRVQAPRPAEFQRKVLGRFRRALKKTVSPEAGDLLRERLRPEDHHLRRWIAEFFRYAMIARRFDEARTAELRGTDGAVRLFFVVQMPVGEEKQLMYDLVARVVDDESIPVDVVIVSSWARTGWNVITPNVLIDATATRQVTAWQQLRGRAMRSSRSWTGDAYEQVADLLDLRGSTAGPGLPLDVSGDETVRPASPSAGLSRGEREELAADLMLSRNKVTHVYELVKAYGSAAQVTRDRRTKVWRRTDVIAAKHAREYAVNGRTGEYGTGESHAPLISPGDPRQNTPDQLREYLASELQGQDRRIVLGWIRAAGAGEDA